MREMGVCRMCCMLVILLGGTIVTETTQAEITSH